MRQPHKPVVTRSVLGRSGQSNDVSRIPTHELGVPGQAVQTGGLEKIKSPIRYLVENSTKSLFQPQDSDNFCFLELPRFCLFCAAYSYNSATVGPLPALTHMSVASSWFGERSVEGVFSDPTRALLGPAPDKVRSRLSLEWRLSLWRAARFQHEKTVI
jgi:hypothetical protein